MKLNITLVLLFIIPASSFGQFKHSIDIVGGLEYSYRHLRSTEGTDLSFDIDQLNAMSAGKDNWRFGFNYNRSLGRKISLKTGLRYASVGYTTDISKQVWGPHYEYPPFFSSDRHFIEVPLIGRFEVNQKRLSPFFELGLSPSLYVNSRTKKIVDSRRGTTTTVTNRKYSGAGSNNLHLVGIISLGLNYSMGDKFQLFGQPAFRYHLTALSDQPIANHLFNYGVEIGLRRKLK